MSQTEQEFIRDFCPHCQINVPKNATSCNICGSGDLIPNPYIGEGTLREIDPNNIAEPIFLTKEEEDLIIGAIPLQAFPPKMESLDKLYEGEALGTEETAIGTPIIPEKPAGSFLENTTADGMPNLESKEAEYVGKDYATMDAELTYKLMNDFGMNPDNPNYVENISGEVIDISEEFLPEEVEEVSKIQLDENAVEALLNKPFGFLTGNAGTGKTTLINELNRREPTLFEICATTGIAAVNLNSKTLHSTLKFFDTKSLENAWREQLLHMNLRKVRARRKNLLIDEASMLGAEQLDLICNAVDDINQDGTGKQLGLWLSGDMCQLPPVKMKYVFKSDYWYQFEQNKVRLTKVWRQDNIEFMEGINLLRANKGEEAMKIFQKCGVHFVDKVDDNFEGTTLIPNNNDVDTFNEKRLRMIESPLIRSQSKIRGQEMNEWSRLVPAELRLKKGAYVMILSNDVPSFNFVNGDCGWIEDYDVDDDAFLVRLKRNNSVVRIKRIKRLNFYEHEPPKHMYTPKFSPYQDFKTGDWVVGEILYHPLRLAYASTIHKSQGLSLDMVQINTRPQFFGYDAMGYVSISRARTPEGLYLVGQPEMIGRKITMNKEVMKYV